MNIAHVENVKRERERESQENIAAQDEQSASRMPTALGVLGLPFGFPKLLPVQRRLPLTREHALHRRGRLQELGCTSAGSWRDYRFTFMRNE